MTPLQEKILHEVAVAQSSLNSKIVDFIPHVNKRFDVLESHKRKVEKLIWKFTGGWIAFTGIATIIIYFITKH